MDLDHQRTIEGRITEDHTGNTDGTKRSLTTFNTIHNAESTGYEHTTKPKDNGKVATRAQTSVKRKRC